MTTQSILHYSPNGAGLRYVSVKIDPSKEAILNARAYWQNLSPLDLINSYKHTKAKGSQLNFFQWLIESANESAIDKLYDL